MAIAAALGISLIGLYVLFGRDGGRPHKLVAPAVSTTIGHVNYPVATSSAWQAPFERGVREGNERSLKLIEDALSQAKQRADVDPAYVAELERTRVALKRSQSLSSTEQR